MIHHVDLDRTFEEDKRPSNFDWARLHWFMTAVSGLHTCILQAKKMTDELSLDGFVLKTKSL